MLQGRFHHKSHTQKMVMTPLSQPGNAVFLVMTNSSRLRNTDFSVMMDSVYRKVRFFIHIKNRNDSY
jgi:hypothetical protein